MSNFNNVFGALIDEGAKWRERAERAEAALAAIRYQIIYQNFGVESEFYTFCDSAGEKYASEQLAWEGFLKYCHRHIPATPPPVKGSD